MKKLIIIFISLITVIAAAALIFVFIRGKDNQNEPIEYVEMNPVRELVPAEADDEFSENIINSVGDVFIYRVKRVSEKMTQYEFDFEDWPDEDTVRRFSQAVTESADIIEGKTQIIVFDWGGMQTGVFSLDNTSDESLKSPDYDGFYRLRTNHRMYDSYTPYLTLISSLEGIRKLETTESFLKESEANGIDWYEVWPDLEEIVILPDT